LENKKRDYVDLAATFFARGYSCSQSVFMAYAERLGIFGPEASRIAAPFGGGMGHLGRTCGAVTGALMVLGARFGHESATDKETKEHVYELVRQFDRRFVDLHGTTQCKALIGFDLSRPEGLASARAEGVFNTRCPGFVRDAAEIVGDILDRENAT